jgi:hypothetical protein
MRLARGEVARQASSKPPPHIADIFGAARQRVPFDGELETGEWKINEAVLSCVSASQYVFTMAAIPGKLALALDLYTAFSQS